MLDALGRPARILLLGGTSEIGIAILAALRAPRETEVLLAGRDEQLLAAAGKDLPYQVATLRFDATEFGSHQALIDGAFDGIVVTDRDGRIVYANAAYLDLTDTIDANDTRPV